MQNLTTQSIKTILEEQFNRTVRLQPVQMARTEFKVNTESLCHSDLEALHVLRVELCCDVEVKRSGTGLVIIVIY